MKQGQQALPLDLEDLLHQGYRYALSLCHNTALAEDIVQDACMKVVKAQKGWNKSYFFTIIRNRFTDLYRRSKRVDVYSMDRQKGEIGPSDLAQMQDAETDLANAEVLDNVLGKIKHDQREALYLSVVEGYTAQEISQLTQTPRNTILSRIHRARQKLASLLSHEDKEQRGHYE